LYGVRDLHCGASYHTDNTGDAIVLAYILTNAHDTQLLIHDCHTYETLYLPALVNCSQSTFQPVSVSDTTDTPVHQFVTHDVFAQSIAYDCRDTGALCSIFISYAVFTVIVHSGFVKQQSLSENIALHHDLSISIQLHASSCHARKSAVHHDLNATLSSTVVTVQPQPVDGFQHISIIQLPGDICLGCTDTTQLPQSLILSTRYHAVSSQLTETSLSIVEFDFAFKS
jgi:hypothetical protein